MLSIKKYFSKRLEKRAVFQLKKKAQKKAEAIKANLLQEKNKGLKKWLLASRSIKKLF